MHESSYGSTSVILLRASFSNFILKFCWNVTSLNYLVTSNIRLVIQNLASLNYSSYFSKFRISESSVAVFMCSIVIDFTWSMFGFSAAFVSWVIISDYFIDLDNLISVFWGSVVAGLYQQFLVFL